MNQFTLYHIAFLLLLMFYWMATSSSHQYFSCPSTSAVTVHIPFPLTKSYGFTWLESIREVTQEPYNSKPSSGHGLISWTAAKKTLTCHSRKHFNIKWICKNTTAHAMYSKKKQTIKTQTTSISELLRFLLKSFFK